MPRPHVLGTSNRDSITPKSRPTRGRYYLAIRSDLLPPSSILPFSPFRCSCHRLQRLRLHVEALEFRSLSPNRSHSNFYESEGEVRMLRVVYHDLLAREGNDWG
jgi:hypothetical protein